MASAQLVDNMAENLTYPLRSSLTEILRENYHWLMVDIRDTRVDDWMFMSSPWPVLGYCMLYYYFVRVLGPRMMKDRPPYEIKNIMLVYNLFQTVFSAWMFKRTAGYWLTGVYNWQCEPVDYSMSPSGLDAADITWWYFLSKFIDYLDSFFFVLRKKFSHLSTLHVVHHGIMPFTAWWGIRYVGGGHTMFCGFLNMGIHTIMYFYYFLAALGPQVQKYLWWKKYLTSLQMVQFAAFTLHAAQPIFIDCGFPPFYCLVILGHGAMFLVMFANFYVQSYLQKDKKIKKEEVDDNGNNVTDKSSPKLAKESSSSSSSVRRRREEDGSDSRRRLCQEVVDVVPT